MPFAPSIRELLAFASGLDRQGFGEVTFAGNGDFEFPELSPAGLSLAGDGDGNFWIADVAPDGDWGPVFYVCHDPPVVAVQAADLAGFIDQVLLGAEVHDESWVGRITGPAVTRIWREEPCLVSVESARRSADPIVSEFAGQLPPTFSVADLRGKEPGGGFAWGRRGPDAQIKRCGRELLFAIEARPKVSFLERLLRRCRGT